MIAFLGTILGVKFVVEHQTEIIIALVALALLIIFLIVRHRKRRAAYLALPVLYVGNRSTRTYHLPSCQNVKNAKTANLVYFRLQDEPARYGFKPCGNCIKQ